MSLLTQVKQTHVYVWKDTAFYNRPLSKNLKGDEAEHNKLLRRRQIVHLQMFSHNQLQKITNAHYKKSRGCQKLYFILTQMQCSKNQ